jgi:predicted ATPase/class 3 adenylate cyclase
VRELLTGTVTFLFTDVEGSTRLLRELGEEYAGALAQHRRALRDVLGRHGGLEVDTQGDAFFIAFARASDALAAAEEGQKALCEGPIRVRMGLHTGEPIVTEEGYVGIDVHRAARIAAAGHGGQILVSQSTYDLVDADSLQDLGEHRLKDLTAPERIYQLGDESFPPLKSLNATNLPIAASPLVGRDQEVDDLVRLLTDSTRLVTITGAGGTGKTRLALQVAGELVGSVSDGVFWVSLAGLTDSELVLPTIAQSLGVRDELQEHVRDKAVVLVLDNLEHLLPAAGALGRLLAGAAGLRLLATSRAPLHLSGEREYPLDPLPPSDAVALFCERARSVGRELEPSDTIEAICRRLDGLPLALELAAARTKLLAPETLLERLGHALTLLTGGTSDAPERHKTLRATIEWSYDLLAEDVRRLFARLSVFAGSFALGAAEEVCEADLDSLGSLVDLSLLKPIGESRFMMLETIREYALDRLEAASEADEMRQRHANHVLAFLNGAEERLRAPDVDMLNELEQEHDNLRAALSWVEQTGQIGAQLELVGRLQYFWAIHGHWLEGRRWAEGALARSEPERTARRAETLVAASRFALSFRDHDAAKAHAQEGLSIFRELGDSRGIAWLQSGLALLAGDSGDYSEAERLHEQATVSAREAGDRSILASATANLADLALRQGQFARAITLSEEALALFRELGNEGGIAWSLYNLGLCLFHTRCYDEAVSAARESLVLSRRLGDIEGLAWVFVLLGSLLAERGDAEVGATLLGVADGLREGIGYALAGAEEALYERTMAELRDALGQERCTLLLAEGRALSLDAAVDLALSAVD